MRRLILYLIGIAIGLFIAHYAFAGPPSWPGATIEMVQPLDRSGRYSDKVTLSDCESIGLAHAWMDTTPNVIYAVICLDDDPGCGSPPRQRECQNCGKKQIKRRPTVHPWEDVK